MVWQTKKERDAIAADLIALKKENAHLNDNMSELEANMLRKNKKQGFPGGAVGKVQGDFKRIYQDQLRNLLVTLIDYKQSPDTLDVLYAQWQLRNVGFTAIGGTSKDDLHVLNYQFNAGADVGFSMFGDSVLKTSNTIHDELTNSDLRQITHLNVNDEELFKDGFFVVIPNKFTYLLGENTVSDWQMIDTYAEQMAMIKASELHNAKLMRLAYFGWSTNKDITPEQIYSGIENGQTFFKLNADISNSVDDVLTLNNIEVPDRLGSLRDSKGNLMYEMLTNLGVNAIENAKKERMNIHETDANNQYTEASGNIYLSPQQRKLDLLNCISGSKLKAEFNQSAYQYLIKQDDTNNSSHLDNENEEQ